MNNNKEFFSTIKEREKFHNDNNLYALCTQETYTQLSSVACDEPVMTSCKPTPAIVRAGRAIQHGAQEQCGNVATDR